MDTKKTKAWPFIVITAAVTAAGVAWFGFDAEMAWGFLAGAAFGWWTRGQERDAGSR